MKLLKESFATFHTNNTNANKTVAVVDRARDRDSHETTNQDEAAALYCSHHRSSARCRDTRDLDGC